MSWSFPISRANSQERDLLHAVLERARAKKVLMFCSGSDMGDEIDYPAGYKLDSFFRIGAARDDGRALDSTGPVEKLNFLFPGVEVIRLHDSDSPRQSGDKDIQLDSATGSSVATALGAGLAATILYCFKASALANLISETRDMEENETREQQESILSDHATRIAEHDLMMAAFQNLGTVTNDRFIKVWESLEPVILVLQDHSRSHQEKVNIIQNLCRSLFRREELL